MNSSVEPQSQVDLLVIGAGMAGLTAAARAVDRGASVLLVESNDVVGGNGRYAGYIWTAPDHQVMAEWNPDGDESLRRTLVDGLPDALDWLRHVGVEVGPAQKQLAFGVGYKFDTNHYIDLCRAVVVAGGELLTSTFTERLLTEDGAVVGALLRLPDGSSREVHATATVLATGGFQGDPDLVAELVHPAARDIPLRSGPASRGDGLRLGRVVGAAEAGDNAGFYGHLIPSGIPFADPADFVDLSLYYSEHGLLFNLDNERFTDESLADHLTTMALLEQPEARGLLIADARVHRDYIIKPYVAGAPSTDKYAIAYRRGGRCGIAESIDELEALPESWGYDGAAIAAQVRAYNEAVAAGSSLTPGRKLDATPLDEPPYYVIEAIPAITFPFHGLRIDDRARVLDAAGTPIRGLYAAGSDSGGLYVRAYAGSLAPAVVFGLAAAEDAVATSTSVALERS
ncbi:FAD-binding protein [Nakamurella sp. YIM 132087]|uniref:FAD-binding protein n=1 Tax=Nakamurella alba TaxID=2665158 RepID=A0A7K1FT00_9ACTN|nr:FAD-dependent oxidoreductase [Nakamurella alba]MTD17241.1 FAD-binding protein [Nakamurella alba]